MGAMHSTDGSGTPVKIILVAGARPNFMKIAPLMEAFAARPEFETFLVHTGQHYDEKMSDLFFRELGIPEPDVNLGVGGGSHAVNTAEIMKRFEQVCLEQRPQVVMVVGDVDSTIACGLVAVKLGIALVHVEAGLRSFDRTMPEEINRLLTDAISDLLLCTEQSGVDNLLREGVDPARIHLVGNVMIDTLLRNRERAEVRHPGAARAAGRRLRRRHAAPAVERRPPGDVRADRRCAGGNPAGTAAGLPGAPAHARAAGVNRPVATYRIAFERAFD